MTASRPLRADARRNRASILTAARETFENEGVLAPLDGIAVRAGVGNATLYRNFPTRDDLLAAVMQEAIQAAVTEAATFARELSPRQALSEWLITLAWHLRIWHDLPYCLANAQQQPDSAMNATTSALLLQTEALLDQAKIAGDVIEHITSDEVFALVITLSWGIDRFGDDEATARRRTQLAIAGIFTQPPVHHDGFRPVLSARRCLREGGEVAEDQLTVRLLRYVFHGPSRLLGAVCGGIGVATDSVGSRQRLKRIGQIRTAYIVLLAELEATLSAMSRRLGTAGDSVGACDLPLTAGVMNYPVCSLILTGRRTPRRSQWRNAFVDRPLQRAT